MPITLYKNTALDQTLHSPQLTISEISSGIRGAAHGKLMVLHPAACMGMLVYPEQNEGDLDCSVRHNSMLRSRPCMMQPNLLLSTATKPHGLYTS